MLFQNTMKLLQKYGMNFLNGLGTTLLLALISVAIGCVIGALVAIMRLSKSKVLRSIATVYTEVIRDTPLLLQLYFFYFQKENNKRIIILEPSEEMVSYIKQYLPHGAYQE